MTSLTTFFSGLAIDRCSTVRRDADKLKRALRHEETRFIVISKGACLVAEQSALMVRHTDLPDSPQMSAGTVFLGRQSDDRYLFAVDIAEDLPPSLSERGQLLGLRPITSELKEHDAALLAYARAMITWQTMHRHCGRCGTPNTVGDGGFVMACPSCDHRAFPRLDPAIIVLVHDGERCLLGRQSSWPEGRFSTLAGFVEPGESLEDAVRREVHEESDVKVGQCRYLGSQPWPFPSAIMLGFHGEALSSDIHLNDQELAEANWFSRQELAEGAAILPPDASIAYRLIEAWFDQWDGPSLDQLGLAGRMFRRPAEGAHSN
jgi:NAD+ diphosphatase